MEAVGGFLTMSVCVELKVPHELVIVTFILYVPGVTKLKEGLGDVAVVPFV